MVQKKDTALLASAFAKVANNKTFWNQWLVADVWATLINQELRLVDEMKVTGSYLSAWLIKSPKYKSIRDLVEVYHSPNEFGIFRSKICKVTAFYVTIATSCPKLNNHMPGGSTKFVREVVATIQTRAATTVNNTTTDLPSTTASTPPPPPVQAEDVEQQECRPRKKAKRWMSLPMEQEPQQRGRFTDGQFGSTINTTKNVRKRKAPAPQTTTTDLDATTTAELDPPPPPTTIVAANEILHQDFFESPEANCLFGMIGGMEEDVSVRTTIIERIQKLTEGFSTPDGWKCVLEDRDSCNTCSAFQIYNIQIKCRYIAIALRTALRKMCTMPLVRPVVNCEC